VYWQTRLLVPALLHHFKRHFPIIYHENFDLHLHSRTRQLRNFATLRITKFASKCGRCQLISKTATLFPRYSHRLALSVSPQIPENGCLLLLQGRDRSLHNMYLRELETPIVCGDQVFTLLLFLPVDAFSFFSYLLV
jgi:hypothetical protein